MPLRILFVDDEFSPDTELEFGSYMSFYDFALREAGFRVARATTSDEAIRIWRDEPFDLAILDVMMPPGDAFANDDTMKGLRTGILLAQELHRIKSDVPIVILSNAAQSKELFDKVLQAGTVRRVLFKLNVTPDGLVKELGTLFAGGRNV